MNTPSPSDHEIPALPADSGIPSNINRRSFIVRNAVIGAAAVMTGCAPTTQARTEQAAKEAAQPAAQAKKPTPSTTDPELNVVKKSKGPVMIVADEFYKVGPGPSSSHTIGPMRITYDFYQRCTKLPADQLAKVTGMKDAKDGIASSFDVLIVRTEHRTNEIVKVLTLASILLLPGALMAGVAGMNVNFKPDAFTDSGLFWGVTVTMVLIALATLSLAPRSRCACTASAGFMCTLCMNQRGSYAPIGSSARSIGPRRCRISWKNGAYAVSPAKYMRA
jgi:hypothetical protein